MLWPVFLLVTTMGAVQSQLTAQSSLAPELRECYMNATLLNRNNLPPATMSVLIDIIRKIEDSPTVNMDLRQISSILLHTYRQDGIEYHQPDSTLSSSANVLPFAPTFHSFHRHRLLLTRLIPNNLQVLANTTLDSTLKCAIHHFLSTTVDARLRGDESSCNQLAQYRALRVPRDVSRPADVEILDIEALKTANKIGQMREYNPNDDVESTNIYGSKSERQVTGDSQCPILDGVVYTPWGAVSAGNLIAGIAAGTENQRVNLDDLSRSSVNGYANLQQYVTSLYPATLSGDLSEAVLIQGTERGSSSITVGAAGGWNSTQARRFYLLQSRVNIEMTDPEIRGGVDGFVLGSSVSSFLSTYSSLKLSQLLDMYYSARNGVFNTQVRACNRQDLSQTYITNQNLVSETYAFAAALDTNMPLRGTITGGLEELIANGANNLQSYITNNLLDLNCVTTEASSPDYRLKTNLYLVIDSAWQYETVFPAISYILDSIEVGKFGSSVTLLNAFDGSVVVNKTFSPADFYSQYTLARHQSLFLGVNLLTTLTNVRTIMYDELNLERSINSPGGNATVLLFLLNSGNIQNNEQILEQARRLNETVPDLRILFATSSNQLDNLWNLVRDMHNDVQTVLLTSNGLNVETSLAGLLQRINTAGRRIINPSCGSTWESGQLSGTRQFDDFVEPGYVNFYAVSPNYFYGNNDNRKVRISRSGAGTGSLVICHSRVDAQPRQNSTTNIGLDANAVTCQTLGTSGNVEISFQNACNGYSTINSCPFFHISVQSVVTGTTAASAICTDQRSCRFPYNLRYQVQIEDFGCFSSGANVAANVLMILSTLTLSLYKLM